MNNPWTDWNEQDEQEMGVLRLRKWGVWLCAKGDQSLAETVLMAVAPSKDIATELLRDKARKLALVLIEFADGQADLLCETAEGASLFAIDLSPNQSGSE